MLGSTEGCEMTYTQLSPEAAAVWLGIESELATVRRVAGSTFTTEPALKSAKAALKRARRGIGELERALRG
jgi:hypothetical protein